LKKKCKLYNLTFNHELRYSGYPKPLNIKQFTFVCRTVIMEGGPQGKLEVAIFLQGKRAANDYRPMLQNINEITHCSFQTDVQCRTLMRE
jgi:hypothetical protein